MSFSRTSACQLRRCNRPLSRSSPPDRAWDRLALLLFFLFHFSFLIFFFFCPANFAPMIQTGPESHGASEWAERSIVTVSTGDLFDAPRFGVDGELSSDRGTHASSLAHVHAPMSFLSRFSGPCTMRAKEATHSQAWQIQRNHWMDRSRPSMVTGSKRSVSITDQDHREGRSDEER